MGWCEGELRSAWSPRLTCEFMCFTASSVSSLACSALETTSLLRCSSSNSRSVFSNFALRCSSIANIRCFLSLAFVFAASSSCLLVSAESSNCPTGAAARRILCKSDVVSTIESISTLAGFLSLVAAGAEKPRSFSVFDAEKRLSSTPPSVLLYRPTDFCDALDRRDPSDETDLWLASGCRKSDL